MKSVSKTLPWLAAILLLGILAVFASPAAAQNDPCNATIVTADGSMTAQDLCDMIKASGKSVTVFHSQCYGGDVAKCCNNAGGGGTGGGGGGSGCHNSGGSPGELQYYDEYDKGTADALKPGGSGSSIHQSGANNTTSSTPVSGGCGDKPTVQDGDTVITFAGDPAAQDHTMGQQIAGQNGNTVNLEGDGTANGVEGAATAEELKKALKNAKGHVWIWISDHGNMGGDTATGECPGGSIIDLILTIAASVLNDMLADPGTSGWIFLDSPNPFPPVLDIVFNGSAYTISGADARVVDNGDDPFYRYLLEVPENSITTENWLQVFNPTNTHFSFEAFVDSGPIEKIGFEPPQPPDEDIEPRPDDERPNG